MATMTNWHLTETPSGAWSVGLTADEPGFYPGDETTQDSWVVPGEALPNRRLTDQEVREYIRAYLTYSSLFGVE